MKRDDGLPRNPRIRYRFKAKPFDFMFQWMIGSSTNGGAEIGEAMYAASRIPDGDGEAWYREFAALGSRVAERASASDAGGHRVSAREAYLRAYVYYRAAPLFLNPRTDERYRAAYETARSLFRQGAQLLDPPLEPITIPYGPAELPGYIAPPTDGSDPHRAPTLLMIGGGDTFVEDLYYYIVPAAGRRGYRVVFVDLPGQGGLPWNGLPMEAEAERPIAAVIDELERRPDIDLGRLAVYGISGGGYLAPRAAAHEPRIRALVACSIILDIESVWSRRLLNLSSSLLAFTCA